ncbi:MAG: hypothetical protein ABI742_13250 [Gemmatimonadota bacterium]
MPDNVAGTGEPLAEECRVFTRYLAGREPDEYIRVRYERGHARIPYLQSGGLTGVDLALLRVARLNPILARAADGYSRFFRPTGALRQKLVLLYAVLENSPDTHAWFNSGAIGGPVVLLGGLALHGLASGASLLLGIVVIGPLHLAARLGGGAGRGGA